MLLVAHASNAAEAGAGFRRHRPDVTLMDLRLPGTNGTDVLIAIRGEFPRARTIMIPTLDSERDILPLVQSEQVSRRSAQSPPEGLGIQRGHVPTGPRNRYYPYCYIIKGSKNRFDTRIGHRSSAHIPTVYSPVNIAGLFA
jgi:CheY-like chemotaxis protein